MNILELGIGSLDKFNDLLLESGESWPEEALFALFSSLYIQIQILDEIHIAHQDIKPSNIIICEDGSIKLVDYSVAEIYLKDDNVSRKVGTWGYMAPERKDPCSIYGIFPFYADIYSMAFTVLECAALQEVNMKMTDESLKEVSLESMLEDLKVKYPRLYQTLLPCFNKDPLSRKVLLLDDYGVRYHQLLIFIGRYMKVLQEKYLKDYFIKYVREFLDHGLFTDVEEWIETVLLKEIENNKNEIMTANYNSILGYICLHRLRFDDAIQYILKALKFYEKNLSYLEMAKCYNNLAIAHQGNHEPSKGDVKKIILYYTQAFKIWMLAGEHIKAAGALNNRAGIYIDNNDPKSALEDLQRVLRMEGIQSDLEEARAYSNLGRLMKKEMKFAQAKEFYLKSLNLRLDYHSHDQLSIALAYEDLIELYMDDPNPSQSFQDIYLWGKVALEIYINQCGRNHIKTQSCATLLKRVLLTVSIRSVDDLLREPAKPE